MLLRLWKRVSRPARATFTAMGVAEEVRTAKRRLDAMARCRLLGPRVRQAALLLTLALGGSLLVPWRLTAAAAPDDGGSPRDGAPRDGAPGGEPSGGPGRRAASVVIEPSGSAASSVSRPGPETVRPRRRAVVSSP
jgi:hypothetical protein